MLPNRDDTDRGRRPPTPTQKKKKRPRVNKTTKWTRHRCHLHWPAMHLARRFLVQSRALNLLVPKPDRLLPAALHVCNRHRSDSPVTKLRGAIWLHRQVKNGRWQHIANDSVCGFAFVAHLRRFLNSFVVFPYCIGIPMRPVERDDVIKSKLRM